MDNKTTMTKKIQSKRFFVFASLLLGGTSTCAFMTTQPLPTRTNNVLAFAAPTFSDQTVSGSASGNGITPGSPLGMICKDQNEFEVNVGKAMDTLRKDYPYILTTNPDFTIYDKKLEVIDPSGVKLNGLSNYKRAFRLLHAIVGIFYCPERSGLTFRMCYDKARQNIRIHWNAYVIPKAIFGGVKTTLYVDGISVYEISRISGNITQHRVDSLIINDTPVMPEQGIFAALRHAVVTSKPSDADNIPVFNTDGVFDIDTANREEANGNQIVKFQSFKPFARTMLFDNDKEINFINNNNQVEPSPSSLNAFSSSADTSSSDSDGASNIDWEALERKNDSRKKFGLKPLTPDEFLELQEKVADMDAEQKKRAAALAAEMASKKTKQKGFLQKLFGDVLDDTCESNFDCQRPEVCCDFGFKKMCCTSGMRVVDGPQNRQGQLAEVPVLASPYPPNGQGNNGGGYGGGPRY